MNDKNNKFGRLSALPKDMAGNTPFLEFTANRSVLIDGCQGILEYQDSIVRINTKKLIVVINGRGLHIKCMTAHSLTICGYISGVEFLR